MPQVTTFYSYKGGSGRSMAMANVAWALASNGQRVLVIDWDLEAPGLHRYFHPFLADPEQQKSAGLIDRIWDYLEGAGEADRKDRFALARCDDLVQHLELPIRGKGLIDLLGAGRQDDRYSEKVGGLDWATFYARFDGEAFIDRLIEWARGSYGHVLIDSRTGVADTAGICTTQIPDALVMCFVYNRQSIEGTAAIARSVTKARKLRKESALKISYVPSRVEERSTVESARSHAAVRLAKAGGADITTIERGLRRDEIRHYPWCAFEEKLAVFEDVPDERGSLLDAMHALARRVSGTDLKIVTVQPDVLNNFWRRAAFDDPRIVELRSLKEGPLDAYWQKLFGWVDDAVEHTDERADWLIELAEAALELAGQGEDRLSGSHAEFLAHSAIDLARRAYAEDARQFRVRYALLLQARASFYLKLGDPEQALRDASESAELFSELPDPVSRWRQARSIERVAEALETASDSRSALEAYRAATDIYQSIGPRQMPLGSQLDRPRSLRQLAEKLLEAGEVPEADELADLAVRQLAELGSSRQRRNMAEIVNILGVRADTAIALDSGTAAKKLARIRATADTLVRDDADRVRIGRRLSLAEARLAARLGDAHRALAILEEVELFTPRGGDDIELRAEILLDIGQPDHAADLLATAIGETRTPVTQTLIGLLQRALSASGREQQLAEILLRRAAAGDGNNLTSWLPLFQQLIESGKKGERLTIDTKSPAFTEFLARSRSQGRPRSRLRKAE